MMHGKLKKTTGTLALAMALGTAGAGVVLAHEGKHDDGRDGEDERYTVALFGDMPYNALGKQQYPALLDDVNAQRVAFSVFDGDLKSGGDSVCSDENLYFPALASFAKLERPVLVAVGDNDWTDCWGRYGASTGGFDPLERLDHERQLFFSTPYSLGQHPMRVTRQSSEGGNYGKYVENMRWVKGPVVYVVANVQGSNDNYPYAGLDGETRSDAEIARQRAEETARKAAVIHWLADSFAFAKKLHAKGVMVIWQADPNFNNEQHLADLRSYDAYADYVRALRAETLAFDGQVALVHGDSHYFKMDKPLNDDQGGVLANFTRVETFGARNTHWVKATVDARNPNLFVFEPRIVPANAK